MKKNILIITLVILGALLLVMPTLAATVSLSPASVSVRSGRSFNVSVTVDPQGTKNYVEKVVLNYPADILQVNSFTLGSTWIGVTQPGNDLTDNTNGVLIKTAGYPAGFSSATNFGTVSFNAKKAGSGTITIGNNSIAFEVSSQGALSGAPVSVTITAPAVTAPQPTTPTQVAPLPSQQPATPTQPVSQPTAQITQPSLAASILTLGTGNTWIGILVGLIILAIIIYVISSIVQKKKRKFGKINSR